MRSVLRPLLSVLAALPGGVGVFSCTPKPSPGTSPPVPGLRCINSPLSRERNSGSEQTSFPRGSSLLNEDTLKFWFGVSPFCSKDRGVLPWGPVIKLGVMS